MIALLASRADPASLTLRDAVLRLAAWSPPEDARGLVLRRSGRLVLAEIPGLHLEADGVDARLGEALGAPPEAVLVLSKHRSESGKPTLTVHAVGNWGPEAKHGGRPRAVSPAAGRLASDILARLAEAPPAGYGVSYEATHHGPLLAAPTAYVEVGSDAEAWEDSVAAEAVARAVLGAAAAPVGGGPLLLGVGGGHYAPRFTDLARRRRAAFGHILPAHALADVEEATLQEAARGHDGFLVDARGDPPGLPRVVEALRGLLPQRSEKELSA